MQLGHPGSQRRRAQLGFSILGLVAVLTLSVAELSHAYSTQRIASGLNRPVYIKGLYIAGLGEVNYIVEQRGVIKTMVEGVMQPDAFLDIDSLVPNISGNDERGLLGFAPDPDFITNGIFYVYYTNNSSDTVVARYYLNGMDHLDADESSAEVVLFVDQPFGNHNGGWIDFDRNNYLWISLGDGGSGEDPGNRGQRGDVLLGKILRIDVRDQATYAIPADNPFVGNSSVLDEIWTLGWRNAWRCSFDRDTGDFWAGDVGQYQWEEVDFEPFGDPGGKNYGWRCYEGDHAFNTSGCNGTYIFPVAEYSHGSGCSITGGYVYRGPSIPELDGAYLYADFCTRRIWSLTHDGNGGNVVVTERTTEFEPGSGLTIASISSFGEGCDGELYVIDRGGATSGEIYEVVPDPSDVPGSNPAIPVLGIQLRSRNPFTSDEALSFALTLENEADVTIEVWNTAGQRIQTLASGSHAAGEHLYSWDGTDSDGRAVSSGVYFIRAGSELQRVTQKIDFLR